MSLSTAQRQILRDMANGAELFQRVAGKRYGLKNGAQTRFYLPSIGDDLSRMGLIGRQPKSTVQLWRDAEPISAWIFTLTPAGAEAAREVTE